MLVLTVSLAVGLHPAVKGCELVVGSIGAVPQFLEVRRDSVCRGLILSKLILLSMQ